MHDGIALSLATSVLVLMVLIDPMGVIPQVDRCPVVFDSSFQHDRIANWQALGSPVPNSDIRVDVYKNLAGPLRHGRIIDAWPVEFGCFRRARTAGDARRPGGRALW